MNNNKDHIIALDIGSTNIKALLYRINEGLVDSYSLTHKTYYPGANRVEQDAEAILNGVVSVVRHLMQKSGVSRNVVTALVFIGIWQSMLPVDKRGKALGRAMTWADTRSVKQSEQLKKEQDIYRIKRTTGCTIHPMYFPSRLVWYQEEKPDIFKQTYKFVSIKEHIIYHLYGEFVVDKSIASGTGIFNMKEMDWDQNLLKQVGINKGKLGRIVDTTTVLKGLKENFASQMGLLSGTPAVVGAADGALSHLGSVGITEKRMSLTVGTGAALRRNIKAPRIITDREAWCYYMTEDNWLLGGVLQDAGNVMEWFLKQVFNGIGNSGNSDRRAEFSLLNRYAEEIEPGAEGLIFLPFLGKERCPNNNPYTSGTIYGLTFVHNKKHLARAVMEGLAYRLYSVYEMLIEDEFQPELVVTGGILKSPVWLQIITDFFGRKMWIPAVDETCAWGGIIVGLRALNIIKSIEEINDWIQLKEKREPDPEINSVYRKSYQRYNNLYDKLF